MSKSDQRDTCPGCGAEDMPKWAKPQDHSAEQARACQECGYVVAKDEGLQTATAPTERPTAVATLPPALL
jgi:hypothetical protein